MSAPLGGHRVRRVLHVAADAEGALTGAGQNDDADGLVIGGTFERVGQLDECLRAKRVQSFGPVDGDGGTPVSGVPPDVLVAHASFGRCLAVSSPCSSINRLKVSRISSG